MKVCVACAERFESLEWTCPSCSCSPKLLDGFLAFSPELADKNEGFESRYFTQLFTLEAKNFWFRSRNRLIIWALKRYFPQAKSFLEVGCGTGFVLSGIEQTLPGLTLHGSEIFSAGLSFAAERLSKANLFQMDACKIPFENEFDVIGAFDVLEHIKEDEAVLAQIYQASGNSGGIILTVPQHPWLWSQADDYAHHVRRYISKELKTKVEGAGFEVIRMTSFVSLLLPLMIISRLKLRRASAKYDLTDELRINGLLNTFLEGKYLHGSAF